MSIGSCWVTHGYPHHCRISVDHSGPISQDRTHLLFEAAVALPPLPAAMHQHSVPPARERALRRPKAPWHCGSDLWSAESRAESWEVNRTSRRPHGNSSSTSSTQECLKCLITILNIQEECLKCLNKILNISKSISLYQSCVNKLFYRPSSPMIINRFRFSLEVHGYRFLRVQIGAGFSSIWELCSVVWQNCLDPIAWCPPFEFSPRRPSNRFSWAQQGMGKVRII